MVEHMSEHPRITILHIDDTEANRYVVSRMLRNSGYNVLEAATGQEGLQLLAQQKPDLIILDVKLPDIDGFDICQQVRTDPKTATIPILFLSANYVKSTDKAYGLETGADAYLIQPVEGVELIATVGALWRMRQAEQSALQLARRWQTTFDAMNDGICLLDRRGQVLRCNRSMQEILNKSDGQLLGVGHEDLTGMLFASGDTPLFALIQQTLNRHNQEKKSGERWFNLTLDPILNEHGEFSGAVYILADITEKKHAEQERIELLAREKIARQEAEAANRLKDEFLATLSHELRSPLNAMLGWSRLLNTHKVDPATARKAMETIEQNAKVQAQLVEDLLDVSQIITGKLRLQVRPVDIVETIQAALETVNPAAQAKAIQIETIIDSRGGMVTGDEERLQQIFWNLFSNAVKFTPKGGKVHIEVQETDSTIDVAVTDTGQGIKSEFLPYVFDRFRQADGSLTRSYGGLGLGLAIVRHLVELHGGTVLARSEGIGRGATFIVTLPLVVEKHRIPTESPTNSPPASILDGVRVLVVDNEEDQLVFLKLAIELYGAKATVVPSAKRALIELINNDGNAPIDVLISDIGMPEQDGYSLIRQVRQLSPKQGGKIPAIALTAYARPEDIQKAIASGFQIHVSKPIDPDELVNAIANILNLS